MSYDRDAAARAYCEKNELPITVFDGEQDSSDMASFKAGWDARQEEVERHRKRAEEWHLSAVHWHHKATGEVTPMNFEAVVDRGEK